MPIWLVEDPTSLYLLLGVLAVVLSLAWWTTRNRKFAIGAVVVLLLLGVVWLLDHFIVSDREQIELNLHDMAQAGARHDLDRVFSHVSEDFRVGSMTKANFRQRAGDAMRRHDVTDVSIWEFEPREVSRAKRTATISFNIKVHGNWGRSPEVFNRVEAEYVLDPDGQWRMRSFQLFQSFVDTRQPVALPF